MAMQESEEPGMARLDTVHMYTIKGLVGQAQSDPIKSLNSYDRSHPLNPKRQARYNSHAAIHERTIITEKRTQLTLGGPSYRHIGVASHCG